MKIMEGIHCLRSTGHCNAYLILREHSLLIDTGFPHRGQPLLEEIAALGVDIKKIDDILLTHHDIDHVGNVKTMSEAAGATIWIGRDDAPYLLGQRPRPGLKRLFTLLAGVQRPSACRYYEDKSEFDGVKVLPAPGHTPGHHLVQYGDVVFIGDLFRVPGSSFEAMNPAMNSDPVQLRQSIRQLAALDFRILCPSHGSPVERTAALDAFLEREGGRD